MADDYVADVGVRLSLYKRLASAVDEAHVADIAVEMEDRFGSPPPEAKNLVELMRLKTELRRLKVLGCEATSRSVTLHLREDTSALNPRATRLSDETLHQVRGGGRGATETVSPPDDGCGSNQYDNSAYVTGTIEGVDLESTVISGQFALTGGDTNSLAFPYRVRISGTYGYVNLEGQMPSASTLALDSLTYPPTTAPDRDAGDSDAGDLEAGIPAPAPSSSAAYGPDVTTVTIPNVTFHRIGDAVCPTP